jgi:hypothetical protein
MSAASIFAGRQISLQIRTEELPPNRRFSCVGRNDLANLRFGQSWIKIQSLGEHVTTAVGLRQLWDTIANCVLCIGGKEVENVAFQDFGLPTSQGFASRISTTFEAVWQRTTPSLSPLGDQ